MHFHHLKVVPPKGAVLLREMEPPSVLTKALSAMGLKAQHDKGKLFTTLEDFERAPTSYRMVVIGCIGSGKSTLLNVLSGHKFVQCIQSGNYDFVWKGKDGTTDPELLFETRASTDAVTKKTAFANIDFLGDENRPLLVVDTPGHDDPSGADLSTQEARDAVAELAADLHNKLKALGHVNSILVLHNDVYSNRLNPATMEILKLVDEKFAKNARSVWDHVIIGYSKCNAHDTGWRAGLERKQEAMRKAIQQTIPQCKAELPVVPLGAGEIEPAAPASADHAAHLEKLWEFMAALADTPLDTRELQPFEGMHMHAHASARASARTC